jgi:uncharacterized damage-inducible protein DinB
MTGHGVWSESHGAEEEQMTSPDLQLLIDFHYWARDRVLDAVEPLPSEQFTRPLGSSFESIRDTLAHLCLTEWAWHQRWQGHSPTATPRALDSYPDVAAIRRDWKERERDVRSVLDALDESGASRVLDYRLMSGQPGRSAFWQTLQHLVNHGSYHRGQVTTMLRQLGAAPAQSTDLITFYRARTPPA